MIDSTYSKRTEKANTTIAFNPSLMRRDQTNNSEMLKMNTSNAIAVISTPLHKLHCRNMEVSKNQSGKSIGQYMYLLPYRCIAILSLIHI